MELLRRTQQLQARMAALPNAVRRRFSEDPALTSLLGKLQELIVALGEVKEDVSIDEFIELEAQGNGLVEAWADQIARAETELRIVGEQSEPVCPYCGSVFPILDPRAEHAIWAKFRKHVEKLHPKEWQAALDA